MLKKEVTYEDYNGEKRTETLFFNLTKAEIAKIQLKENGNFIEYMQRLLQKKKIEELYLFFEDFVRRSYGEKSLDGSKFIKTPEITQDFEFSPAFSEVVMSLVESPDELQRFVMGVIPKDMVKNGEVIDVPAVASGE